MGSAQLFFDRLGVGCDVDFCKVSPGRVAYWDAIALGVSIPQHFKARGFDHWRIRVMEYDLVSVHPKTQKSLLQEIAGVAFECVDAGLTAIVAFQGEDFKLNPTDAEIDRVIDWWSKVAFRFKGLAQGAIAFNLIIETTGQIPDQTLNDLYDRCYKAIQEIDPGRICIVCPNRISSPEKLPALVVPGEYCFVESHLLAAGPSPTNPNKKWTIGTDSEKAAITAKLDLMSQFRDRAGIPVWIGAIMSGNYNSDGDPTALTCDYTASQQADFVTWFMVEAKQRGIPVAWNSDTKFYDREACQWIESQALIVDAIVA